jgi:hypothetical protein
MGFMNMLGIQSEKGERKNGVLTRNIPRHRCASLAMTGYFGPGASFRRPASE